MVQDSGTPVRPDRLRALNLPRRVVVERDADGGWKALEDVGKRATIVETGEVWRVDDEWWRTPISRRYVEVVLEGGKHLMLFEDLTTGTWFAQSI